MSLAATILALLLLGGAGETVRIVTDTPYALVCVTFHHYGGEPETPPILGFAGRDGVAIIPVPDHPDELAFAVARAVAPKRPGAEGPVLAGEARLALDGSMPPKRRKDRPAPAPEEIRVRVRDESGRRFRYARIRRMPGPDASRIVIEVRAPGYTPFKGTVAAGDEEVTVTLARSAPGLLAIRVRKADGQSPRYVVVTIMTDRGVPEGKFYDQRVVLGEQLEPCQ